MTTDYQRDFEKRSFDVHRMQSNVSFEDSALSTLVDQGFTIGLAKSLVLTRLSFPLRIWVIDNSGSMRAKDGKRLVPTERKDDVKTMRCTRWEELKETLRYHFQLAATMQAPTIFRLLNDEERILNSQQFSIAERNGNYETIMNECQSAISIIDKVSPRGVTPLIMHILEIQALVMKMSSQLKSEGKRVAIILATDGLPTDEFGIYNDFIREQFIGALRLLEGHPVWLVVRLCTNEEDVVKFYNNLDSELELSVDVIDDFLGEAAEIHMHNPWLNYALPLHRMREMGFHDRIFDALDERSLTLEEIRDFVMVLFGKDKLEDIANPDDDFDNFMDDLKRLLNNESNEWNPVTKRSSPWIDLQELRRLHDPQYLTPFFRNDNLVLSIAKIVVALSLYAGWRECNTIITGRRQHFVERSLFLVAICAGIKAAAVLTVLNRILLGSGLAGTLQEFFFPLEASTTQWINVAEIACVLSVISNILVPTFF